MTSRERVRLTLNHKEADRIPMDLWGSASRIHTQSYLNIAKHSGLEIRAEDRARPGTTTEYVDFRLSDMVDSDFRHINIRRPEDFMTYQTDENGVTFDEWGIGRKLVGGFNAITTHPLRDMNRDTLKAYKWPDPFLPQRTEGIKELAENFYHKTEKAITATSAVSGVVFENCQYLCGDMNFFCAFYQDEYFVDMLIDKLTELVTNYYLHYLKDVGQYCEWVEFTEDLATQNAPFISPETFRRFFKKGHTEMFRVIKQAHPNIKIWFHSCGAVKPLLPDLIDCGVDIMNPMQPFAKDMESNKLKREFGDSVCFHGGVDIQYALPGDLEGLETEVKGRMQAFAPGGGYIFSPTNHVMSDVPVENFFKLYEYGKKYGTFPIK